MIYSLRNERKQQHELNGNTSLYHASLETLMYIKMNQKRVSLSGKHSYYDKRGQIMGLRLRSPCNLDAGRCQKDNSSATPRSYCGHELDSSPTVDSC